MKTREVTKQQRPHQQLFSARHLLNVLQMSETALKTLSEKLTFTLTYFMLGSWRRSSLCWGVNWSLASACIPYLSNVQCVLRSQVFFFSHHSAWSDQSFLTSRTKKPFYQLKPGPELAFKRQKQKFKCFSSRSDYWSKNASSPFQIRIIACIQYHLEATLEIKVGKNPRGTRMRHDVSMDHTAPQRWGWSTKPRGREWPDTFPERDFTQVFRFKYRFLGSPSPPCKTHVIPKGESTWEAEPEGGCQEEFNTVSSPGLAVSTHKAGKFPHETKSYFPKEQQCKTQQSRLLPAGT